MDLTGARAQREAAENLGLPEPPSLEQLIGRQRHMVDRAQSMYQATPTRDYATAVALHIDKLATLEGLRCRTIGVYTNAAGEQVEMRRCACGPSEACSDCPT